MKLKIFKLIAGLCAVVAAMDLSTTSIYIFHQPEIPEELK